VLVPKVRPYRNAIAIFRNHNNQTVTASQNAFAVYRGSDFEYPYYLVAFLRHEIGLRQIVMSQSGTTYPTVTEDDISAARILLLDDNIIRRIDSLYSEHVDNKEKEESLRKEMMSIIENKCILQCNPFRNGQYFLGPYRSSGKEKCLKLLRQPRGHAHGFKRNAKSRNRSNPHDAKHILWSR